MELNGGRGTVTVGVAEASPAVVELAAAVESLVAEGVLPVGLDAGERPVADVAVLLELLPQVEAVLGMRMARAETAGCLPFMAAGGMAAHRWWSRSRSRGLSRAGHLANRHPAVAAAWTVGVVTGEHVDAAAVGVHALPDDRADAVLEALKPLWGRTTPADVRRFCARARAIVDPAADPDERAVSAHAERYVSFAVLDDTVHVTGRLARMDGELLMNTLHATAESLRVAGDGVTAAQRRADALMVLAAGGATHASVAVTITTDGEATTSGRYLLTPGETRHALCDPQLTAIVTSRTSPTLSACRPADALGAPRDGSSLEGGQSAQGGGSPVGDGAAQVAAPQMAARRLTVVAPQMGVGRPKPAGRQVPRMSGHRWSLLHGILMRRAHRQVPIPGVVPAGSILAAVRRMGRIGAAHPWVLTHN